MTLWAIIFGGIALGVGVVGSAVILLGVVYVLLNAPTIIRKKRNSQRLRRKP